MTILTLTRFELDKGHRYFGDQYFGAVEGTDCSPIGNYMMDCIKRQASEPNQPRCWSFARHSEKKHSKAAIFSNTAAVLEYPLSAKADLLMAMADLDVHHFVIHTDDGTSNRVAVIIPFKEAMLNEDTKSNRYSRLVSVLLERIRVKGAVPGVISSTFHIQPTMSTKVEAFAGSEYLDAASFIKNTKEVTAKASKYIEGADAQKDQELIVRLGECSMKQLVSTPVPYEEAIETMTNDVIAVFSKNHLDPLAAAICDAILLLEKSVQDITHRTH